MLKLVRAVSLEYCHLENTNLERISNESRTNLEVILISKIWAMEISRNINGNLKFNLENGNLKESDAKPGIVVGNLTLLGIRVGNFQFNP